MDIPALLAHVGLLDAEVVGTKAGKSIVRVYTEAKGWSYAKVGDDQHELANFAATLTAKPPASRKNLKAGK